METYYLLVNGQQVNVGDVVDLQFVITRENIFSRDDRGVVIILDRSYPLNVELKRSGRKVAILRVRIARFVPGKNNRFCAVAVPEHG